MPSFLYSSVTIEQLDEIDGYAPSVQPATRSTQLTLVELVKQRQPQPRQQPTARSNLPLDKAAHDQTVNAEVPLPRLLQRRYHWSPSPGLTHDSLAMSFFVSVLLLCSLCVDQFAITHVALESSDSPHSIDNPSGAPTSNTLGAFTFCRAGSWTSTNEADATSYTFAPGYQCSRIGSGCEADGWSLASMLGRSESVSCGLFDVFRAYLLIAFFTSVGAAWLGVLYVRRRPSPPLCVAVVFLMVAVTVTTLIAACVIESMLPASARHTHSFWLLIAALLVSVPCSALFAHSEHKRLYPTFASPPDAIHSGVPPVRLTEDDDGWDGSSGRREYEVSQATYTLDDDHGALLAIEDAAQQPPLHICEHKEAALNHPTATSSSSLHGRRASIAFIAATAGGGMADVVESLAVEEGETEAEVSVSRIDMQQAEWDDEAEEARMEGIDPIVRQRSERLRQADECEQKTQETSK